MKTQILIGLTTISLLACGEVAEDAIPQLIADAGQLLADAGQALADAGQALTDAGLDLHDSATASAQSDSGTAKGRRVLESACDQVRTLTGTASSRDQHFARFDVKAEDLRSAWLCDGVSAQDVLACPTQTQTQGVTCSGAAPPKTTCTTLTAVNEGEDGTLWIDCSGFRRARIVLD